MRPESGTPSYFVTCLAVLGYSGTECVSQNLTITVRKWSQRSKKQFANPPPRVTLQARTPLAEIAHQKRNAEMLMWSKLWPVPMIVSLPSMSLRTGG